MSTQYGGHWTHRFAWIVLSLAGSSLALGQAVEVTTALEGDGALRIRVVCPIPDVVETEAGAMVTLGEEQQGQSPGDPQLPERRIVLALPPDVDTSSLRLRVVDKEEEVIRLSSAVLAAPPLRAYNGSGREAWGADKDIHSGRNRLVYERDAEFPGVAVSSVQAGGLREWRLATLTVYPVQYHPLRQELRVYRTLDILLEFARLGEKGLAHRSGARDAMAAALIENPLQAAAWYGKPSAPKGTVYDYAILTTNEIVEASMRLRTLEQVHEARGMNVMTVTEDGWYSSLAGTKLEGGWGGGIGDPAAENLRAWLVDHYEVYGIEQVLLIGNPHPAEGEVPMKLTNPGFPVPEWEYPTDLYYAELSGNWDLDGDRIFAEYPDDYQGLGGMDLNSEVLVGRIPSYDSDFESLDSILSKTCAYLLERNDLAWRKKVLVSCAKLNPVFTAYHLGEAIRTNFAQPAGWYTHRLYECDCGDSREGYLTTSAVTSNWAEGYGLHVWSTHGSVSDAQNVFNGGSVDALDNERPSFVAQSSCLNGVPEQDNNLGYALLKRGAIGTVSASRIAWGSWTELGYLYSCDGLNYGFARGIIGGLSAGEALAVARASLLVGGYTAMEFNLYGDPSAGITTSAAPISLALVEPSSFFLSVYPGDTGASQTLKVKVFGSSAVSYSVAEVPPVSWMHLPVSSGESSGELDELEVTLDVSSLPLGTHTSALRFEAPGVVNAPIDIPVTVRVERPVEEVLDAPELVWSTGGAAAWQEDNIETHDGVDSLRSGPMDDSSSSYIKTVVDGPGTLSFWWRVSSEQGGYKDRFEFYLDGSHKTRISGEQDWQYLEYTISDKPTSLEWFYRKNSEISAGEDAAWLDQVRFTPVDGPYISLHPQNLIMNRAPGGLPEPVSCALWNSGSGALNYSLSTDVDWLVLSALSGVSTGETDAITLSVDPLLAPPDGMHEATLTLTAPGGVNSPLTRKVQLRTQADFTSLGEALDAPHLPWRNSGIARWTGLARTDAHDGVDNALCGKPDNGGLTELSLDLEGPGTLTFWRRVAIANGYFQVDVDGEAWPSGQVTGNTPWKFEQFDILPGSHTVRWRGVNFSSVSTGVFQVYLDQVEWVPRSPIIEVAPDSLEAECQPRQDAPSQSFELWNAGTEILRWNAHSTVSWISISPDSGESRGEHDNLTVKFDTSSLPPGEHQADIIIGEVGVVSAKTLPVQVTVGNSHTVLVPALRDTTLYSNDEEHSNSKGDYMAVGRAADGVRRGLLAFDLSGIPTGATVTSARPILDIQGGTVDFEVQLHRMTGAWGEGTSNATGDEYDGAAATKHDATWLYRDYDYTTWAQQGGDYTVSESAARAVSGPARYSWDSTPEMVGDVQTWVDVPGANYGWLLRGPETRVSGLRQVISRENPDTLRRPQLEIAYVIPETPTISVPDLVGLQQEDAEALVLAASLRVGAVSRIPDYHAPKGEVMSQSPPAGALVVSLADVDLEVSDGLPFIAVPEVVGLTQAEAEAAIESSGLAVGEITTSHTTFAVGIVARQFPPAGKPWLPDAEVDLIVSLGSGDVLVPEITGLSRTAARQALENAWLTVGVVKTESSMVVPPGYVVSQAARPGTSVDMGRAVGFTVSSGPAVVSVPQLLGLYQADAESLLESIGLLAGTISSAYSEVTPEGQVSRQSREPGASVLQGERVDFTISLGTVDCISSSAIDVPFTDTGEGISSSILRAESGNVAYVSVEVDFWAQDNNELSLSLRSPSGTLVDLFTQNCGGQGMETVTFADDALLPICNEDPLPSAAYAPVEPLASLLAEPVGGTWDLLIYTENQPEAIATTLYGWKLCIAETENNEGEGGTEGEGAVEGDGEGIAEGEGEGLDDGLQSADLNGDFVISLSELLRVVQFYNSLGYQCADMGNTEDGYFPGPGANHTCSPYDTDYDTQDWVISLSELLRIIQFYNARSYRYCPDDGTEDGFCPVS